MDGVTLARDLTLRGDLKVTHGLTLRGARLIANTPVFATFNVFFLGSQTLGGTGEVVFAGSGFYTLTAQEDVPSQGSASLTIGPEITVHGGGATFTRTGDASILNQGTITADVAGQRLTFADSGFSGRAVNQGTLKAVNGGAFCNRTACKTRAPFRPATAASCGWGWVRR